MATSTGYSRIQILLHWTIAVLVLVQLVFGESMTAFVDGRETGDEIDPADILLASSHYWVGISILGLLVVRILLRLASGAPTPSGSDAMQKMASAAHIVFYILLFVVPVTGLLAFYFGDPFSDIHGWLKPAFIALIILHAGAAAFHEFVLKDGTLQRMLRPVRK